MMGDHFTNKTKGEEEFEEGAKEGRSGLINASDFVFRPTKARLAGRAVGAKERRAVASDDAKVSSESGNGGAISGGGGEGFPGVALIGIILAPLAIIAISTKSNAKRLIFVVAYSALCFLWSASGVTPSSVLYSDGVVAALAALLAYIFCLPGTVIWLIILGFASAVTGVDLMPSGPPG